MIIRDLFYKLRVKSKCFIRNYKLMNMFCKRCGRTICPDEYLYDWGVSDEDWSKIPQEYQEHVLCLNCFCELYPVDDGETELKIKLYK